MKTRLITKRSLLHCSLISLLGIGAPAYSQETGDEIFELSPFTVDSAGDIGYFSSNAFSAYRINLPISQIPFSIQVITRELIEDVRAVDLEDLAPFTAGVGLQVENNNSFERGGFTIRGLNTSMPKRNGVPRYALQDTTNIVRVEVVKGPASAMYGAAEPGGVINYVTKQPTVTNTADLSVTIGTWDYFRTQLGVSGPIGSEQLLFRIDASFLDREGYRDFETDRRTFVSGLLQWEPMDKLLLKADIEYSDRKFNPVSRNMVWNPDAFARWNALPEDQKFAVSALRSVPQDANGNRVWNAIADHLPLSLNAAGPDAYNEVNSLVGTFEAQYELNENLNFRAVATRGKTDNENLFASANRLRVTGDGVARSHRSNFYTHEVLHLQTDAFLKFETGNLKHRFLFGVEHLETDFEQASFRDSGSSQLLYFSPASAGIMPPGADLLDYRLDPQDRSLGGGASTQENNGFYASYMLAAFDDRLNLLTGVRRDRNSAYDAAGIRSRPPVEQTSVQIGVSYKVVPNISLFVNYAESFQPQLGLFSQLPEGSTSEDDIVRVPRRPQIGEGYDLGFKIDSDNGRISGTVSFFKIERFNVVAPLVIFPDGPNSPDTSFRADRYIAGEESQGLEVSLLLAPIPTWQIILNYAYIDAKRNDPERVGTWSEDFDRMVPGVPENQFSIWTKYRFTEQMDGLSIGGGIIWQDKRGGGLTRDDMIILDSFARLDLFAQYKFNAWGVDSSLTVNVENAFDEVYFRPGPILERPANVKITYRIDF